MRKGYSGGARIAQERRSRPRQGCSVLGDFQLFASGENRSPWPIIFVGGNHEPYGFLDHYPDGGPIHGLSGEPVPKCYYMGRAGWAELWGIRVIGVSGIFANEDVFNSERPAITMIGTAKLKRFAYMRRRDVERAYEIGSAVRGDLWLLHDWPESDLGARLGRGTNFDGKHGNPRTLSLIREFAPQRVLCGHMHIPMDWELPQRNGSSTLVHALGYLPLAQEGCVQILEWDAASRSIRRLARWNGAGFQSDGS
ncbi:MAG: hypothetical protein AB1714_05940 [Acidobacteriota bacterium]